MAIRIISPFILQQIVVFRHGDFVMLDISKEISGFAMLTSHVKSDTCMENKFTLVGANEHVDNT